MMKTDLLINKEEMTRDLKKITLDVSLPKVALLLSQSEGLTVIVEEEYESYQILFEGVLSLKRDLCIVNSSRG